MTGRRALLGFLVAAVAGAAFAQDADEWERPFTDALPPPEPGVSINPAPKGVELLPRGAAFIVDAATGLPVPGSTLTVFPEWTGFGVTSYATPLATGAADARGFATVEATGLDGGDGHWVADAPGYAPAYEYGDRPAARFLLERGADVLGRILDPMGRPVEGAEVDVFPGCSHSGTVRSAKTGKDGAFTLRAVDPGGFHACVKSSAGACRREDGIVGLGRRTADVALRTGMTIRGRIVDRANRPIAGVHLRDSSFERWPDAVTGADGRYEIAGLELGADLYYSVPPFDRRAEVIFGLPAPPLLAIVVRHDREEDEPIAPHGDAACDIHVTGPGGAPAANVGIVLQRLGDGAFSSATTGDEDDLAGVAVLDEVPSGEYLVAPESPFQEWTFAPETKAIPPGDRTRIDLIASRQPPLAVTGSVPEGASVSLVVPGAELAWDDETLIAHWHPPMPSTGEAVVRVEPYDGQRVAFFFPVGAVVEGARRVAIELPPPHRITLEGAKLDDQELRCDGHRVASEEDAGALVTYAQGPMTLDVKSDDGPTRRFAFTLGAEGRTLALTTEHAAPGDDAPPPPQGLIHVRAVRAEGAKVRVEYGSMTAKGDAGVDVQAVPPARVVITRPGHQTFDRTFAESAEIAHTWGNCALHLAVTEEDAGRIDAIVSVDGVLHWTKDGLLELAGFDAGPHEVLIDPVDPTFDGRALRVVLSDGETRRRTILLRTR